MTKLKRTATLFVALLMAAAGVGLAASPAQAAGPFFYYAKASQAISNTGIFANLSIAAPAVASGDFHSLTELSVQSADQQQTIEVGWTVDATGVNGTDHTNPHLFVYYWVNGVQKCYNTNCPGFVQFASPAPQAGQVLTAGTAKSFGIQHGGTPSGWAIYYNGAQVGYYPDTLWSSPTFTTAGFDQAFTEVSANVSATCTDAGNGLISTNTGADVIGSVQYPGRPTTDVSMATGATNATYYSITALSARTFRVGGPGAC
jgi:hypothetical protein